MDSGHAVSRILNVDWMASRCPLLHQAFEAILS